MELIKKYKDVISYLFFGVCTTLVNILSYWACAHLIRLDTMVSTVLSWIIAVLFAFVTNRKWVFHSLATSVKDMTMELVSFFCCRIATGILDWGIMWVFAIKSGFNDVYVKTVANIVVIILNYVASKLFVFKRGVDNEG